MKCSSCYAETKVDFCPRCRKNLFNGVKVSSTLTFGAPKAENLPEFQKHTKRLSISGVQLKYSLRLEGKQLILTENDGQYLIKPIPPSRQIAAIDDAPENEHLTMQIASQIFKIRTAPNALIYFHDGEPAYITRRFDVKPDGTKYQQEDFAQLLERTSASHGQNYKYDGSYYEIGLLINRYVAAAPPALEELFKLVTFNYIISNGDAHLKNFSLILEDTKEYRLSPAYDLMSTKVHTPYESDIALDLYKDCMETPFYGSYGYYGRPDFIEFARRLGIVEKRAIRTLDDYIANEAAVISMVEKSTLSPESKKTYVQNFKDKLFRIGDLQKKVV